MTYVEACERLDELLKRTQHEYYGRPMQVFGDDIKAIVTVLKILKEHKADGNHRNN